MRIVFFLLVNMVCLMCGKNFSKCELYKELGKQGFHREQLRDWVCLVEAESSRRTDVIGGPDEDGSYDYGLFQINDRYWCNTGARPGKDCNVRCKDLLLDNITIASKCTKEIYRRQGFDAWVGWVNECKDKELANVSDCDEMVAN